MTLTPDQYPDSLKPHAAHIKGIFVCGCISRGEGSRFRAKAHAHTTGKHKGWLCVLSAKRLPEPMLMLHEVAHLISEEGHTAKWRETVLTIGGTLDPVPGLLKSYHAKARTP